MSNNIKPIEETNQIKKIETPKNNNENKTKTITNLPTWSIEPPLKINRGQK